MQKRRFSQNVGLARVSKHFIHRIRSFCPFNENKVPVVVVFTKIDALDAENWMALREENLSWQQVKHQVLQKSLSKAVAYFENLGGMVYPPKGSVYLRGMIPCQFQKRIHTN